MMTRTRTIKPDELYSVGFVCGMLRAPHATLMATMQRLGIQPRLIMNGVPQIDRRAVERLRTELASNPGDDE